MHHTAGGVAPFQRSLCTTNAVTVHHPVRRIHAKTQKEVRQKLAQAIAAVDTGTYFEPVKMTLGKWLDIWLSEYLLSQKYGTIKHYKSQVNNHIKPALGAVRLSALTGPDIQTFYNHLLKSGKTVKVKDKQRKITIKHEPLSQKSVHNVHIVPGRALSQAVESKLLKENPMVGVTPPKAPKPDIVPLTDSQVRDYLARAESDPLAAMLKTIIFTGLREGEAMGLTWDDIDFEHQKITVRKQIQDQTKARGGLVSVPLKNDKIRVISVSTYVINLLKQQEVDQKLQRMRAAEYWKGWQSEKERSTALVFTNVYGLPYRPKTVYYHHKKIAKAIGAPDARVHDLRHTYAVISLENGDDVKTVQKNLGHASAAFTLDTYGHVSERMRKESAERMDSYISDVLGV